MRIRATSVLAPAMLILLLSLGGTWAATGDQPPIASRSKLADPPGPGDTDSQIAQLTQQVRALTEQVRQLTDLIARRQQGAPGNAGAGCRFGGPGQFNGPQADQGGFGPGRRPGFMRGFFMRQMRMRMMMRRFMMNRFGGGQRFNGPGGGMGPMGGGGRPFGQFNRGLNNNGPGPRQDGRPDGPPDGGPRGGGQ